MPRDRIGRSGREHFKRLDPRAREHWPGCEEVHLPCALRELGMARADLEWHADVLAEAGAAVSLARATFEAMPEKTLQQEEAMQGLIDLEDRLDAPREFDHPEMGDETAGR